MGLLTSSRNKAPTWSSPVPPSSTDPSASSKRSTNVSANIASSAMLLNIIRVSSRVMGGPNVDDAVDDSEAVERVRVDESDEGGVMAFR